MVSLLKRLPVSRWQPPQPPEQPPPEVLDAIAKWRRRMPVVQPQPSLAFGDIEGAGQAAQWLGGKALGAVGQTLQGFQRMIADPIAGAFMSRSPGFEQKYQELATGRPLLGQWAAMGEAFRETPPAYPSVQVTRPGFMQRAPLSWIGAVPEEPSKMALFGQKGAIEAVNPLYWLPVGKAAKLAPKAAQQMAKDAAAAAKAAAKAAPEVKEAVIAAAETGRPTFAPSLGIKAGGKKPVIKLTQAKPIITPAEMKPALSKGAPESAAVKGAIKVELVPVRSDSPEVAGSIYKGDEVVGWFAGRTTKDSLRIAALNIQKQGVGNRQFFQDFLDSVEKTARAKGLRFVEAVDPKNIAVYKTMGFKEAEKGVLRKAIEPTVPAGQARAVSPEIIPKVSEVPPVGKSVTGGVPPAERVKAIQQQGQLAPESVPVQAAKESHIELAAPDGPKPPKPPKAAKGAPRDEPSNIARQIADKAIKGDRLDQTLLRLHEAAINNAQRRVGIAIREGNQNLRTQGIGVWRRGQLVPKEQDIAKLDELYNALHNPSKVASGEIKVPKGFKGIYDDLRQRTDWQTSAMLDFDPKAAVIEDYFYRGWKPPEGAFADVSQGRPLVKFPAFKKPRVNATYQEMRDAGFEPLFWNPYQQWGLRQMMGTKYREQMELVSMLKGMGDDLARPHAGGPIPEGWRVPEVGPAFEGKPFATLDAMGEPAVMYTRRWIVPDKVANTLENIYGKRPSLGKVVIGGKTIDPLAVIDWLSFLPKRAKLFASFFQQIDFLNRAEIGNWSMVVDALQAGKPIKAVSALARYPKTAATILRANFSPTFRLSLAKQFDSTVPLVKGRAGLTMKSVSEAGLSTVDPTLLQWKEMDKIVRMVVTEAGVMGRAKQVVRRVGDLESAMRRGLFEGVYPAAIMTDLKNNIVPLLARQYPKLSDNQISALAAKIANKKYSTIPASQSVIQNRAVREILRRALFSTGEAEGLLRQATGVFHGPEASYWRKHWVAAYVALIATASAIHFASTGEPLPVERYTPIAKDKWGPLPFGYNTRFASPTIPIKGRGGAELTLDVVGQMDTALRVLNPGFFLSSRESVPIRAMVNQVSGTDFFGKPIDDVGPGGVVSRTSQLAQDLFSPIGMGGISAELARRNIPGAEQIVTEGETRLGLPGLGIQATGLNVRAATREMRLQSLFGPEVKATLGTLDKLGLDLGYVTSRFDTKPGVKGGEIELTSAQREELQWLTDDAVIRRLQSLFARSSFSQLSDEKKKERTREHITDAREIARAAFRKSLRTGTVSGNEGRMPMITPAISDNGGRMPVGVR